MGGKLKVSLAMLLVVAVFILSGCGSASTTSPAEAKAVAVAETRFLNEWGHAYHLTLARCKGLSEEAGRKCVERVEYPPQGKAMGRFAEVIEGILDEGVGPECTEELEETLATLTSVSSFPGGATATCREESRRAS
jgi:hypothetical protein